MRWRVLYVSSLAFGLALAGCASFPGSPPSQLRWGTYHTHAAHNGVLLYGDAGDEVRLLNPAGAIISSAVLHPPNQTPCKANYVLPLQLADVATFGLGQSPWPVDYRLQTVVAGHWTDIIPLNGGCNATE